MSEGRHDHGLDARLTNSCARFAGLYTDQNPAALPGAVVYPRSTEDVQRIVKVANEFSIPLIPFSGLTSLEGHVHAPNLDTGTAESYDAIESDKLPKGRAWCLSFSENMNNIVELHKDDLDVIVQPGMPYEVLNNEIAPHGLFFATDPGPGVSLRCVAFGALDGLGDADALSNRLRSEAWWARAPVERTPSALGPCERTCCTSPSSWPTEL